MDYLELSGLDESQARTWLVHNGVSADDFTALFRAVGGHPAHIAAVLRSDGW